MKINVTILSIAASLVLYTIALFLPALRFEAHAPVKGMTTLLWGWWGLLSYDFPWLANIAYALALAKLTFGKQSDALKYIVAAIVLGLLTLLVKGWCFTEAESTPVKSIGSAFYVWMGSFAVLLINYFVRKS